VAREQKQQIIITKHGAKATGKGGLFGKENKHRGRD